jgi:DMSO/TMAO reductase YedYZ molybdopterin-dependent catalytic subunit
MAFFRKKPVVIEAVQWTGYNLREVIALVGLHPSARKWSWSEYEAVVREQGLKLFTLEGRMSASLGDWVIKGVKGEAYACKPDIFAATYEPAPAEGEGDE